MKDEEPASSEIRIARNASTCGAEGREHRITVVHSSSSFCLHPSSFVFAFILLLLLAACAAPIQRAGIPTQWQPSPSFGERRPNFVIIHHSGEETIEKTLWTLTDPRRELSAHYLIGRTGTIYQLVDERARAWHAGESQWGANNDLNSSSLGIELDNNGNEPFPEAQIAALLTLLKDIQQRYQIRPENFLGHADIAPRRKTDPSRYFPWSTLAQYGFGRWCTSPLSEPPASFDAVLALRALGYDVSDVAAAIRAFKLHFVPDDTTPILTSRDKSILFCVLSR